MIVPIGILVCLFLIYKWYKSSKRTMIRKPLPFLLHKMNWKKDVVYLIQSPVSPQIRNTSPFCIKVETWLRMTGVPFEPIYTSMPGFKPETLIIELNGQQIQDSNIIIDFLKQYFKDRIPKVMEVDGELAPAQRAAAHMTARTLENHTAVGGYYWRFVQNQQEYYEKLIVPSESEYSSFGLYLYRKISPVIIKMTCWMHGISRHSMDDIAEFTYRDLDAISQNLGNKKFYFGDHPTSIDCTIFGHLVPFIYLPMDAPQKAYLKKNCQNIVSYMDRIKSTYWPDWEEQCQKSCMVGRRG